MKTMKSIPAKQDGFTVRVIGDETILVNEKGDMLHTLNQTGSFIWGHIDGKTPLEQICKKLFGEFDAPAESIESDIMVFFDELERNGIIRYLQ
jgi:hypothetical protein